MICLMFAFSAEFLLRDFLPSHLLTTYVGEDSPYAIPLAVLVGAPMYLDGLAALPLVEDSSISACHPVRLWHSSFQAARSVYGASWP